MESQTMQQSLQKERSISAEVFNALTHGIAVLLSIIGTGLLVQKGLEMESLEAVISYGVYGMSNILLFLSSTLYHSFCFTKAEVILQKIDHAAIYLLIAGSYTPILVLPIGGNLGLGFLILIWIIAISGLTFEIKWTNRYPRLSTILYLAMGWLGIFLVYPLFQNMAWQGILWLVIGGLLYSIGTIFYRQKDKPWMHVIWHLFVIAGAAGMFMCIYFYT